MDNAKQPSHRRMPEHASTKMKKALRRWSEEQWTHRVKAKILLVHLSDHADEKAQVYILPRYFSKLMEDSPRIITFYLRKLEAAGLVRATGDFIRVPGSGKRPIYRLAPGDAEIDLLAASADASDIVTEIARPGGRRFASDNSDAARLAWVVGALPYVMFDFCDTFGAEAFVEYLASARVCIETNTIKPSNPYAQDWLIQEAVLFFQKWRLRVGEWMWPHA